jgi:chromosome segregation ATPase
MDWGMRGLMLAAGLVALPALAQAPNETQPEGPAEYRAILQAEVEELEAQRRTLDAAVVEAKRTVEEETAARDLIAEEASARQREIDSMLARLDGLKRTVEEADAAAGAAEARKKTAEGEAGAADARLKDVNGEVNRLDDALKAATLNRAEAERDRAMLEEKHTAAEASLKDVEDRLETSKKALVAATAEQEQAEQAAEKLAAVQGEVSDAERELETLRQAVATATARRDEAARAADAAVARRTSEEQAATTAAARRRSIEAEIAAAGEPQGAPAEVTGSTSEADGGRRSPAAVAAAVGTAPGLGDMTAEARAELVSALENGACVTDALRQATGSVNRLSAAALVRGVGDC